MNGFLAFFKGNPKAEDVCNSILASTSKLHAKSAEAFKVREEMVKVQSNNVKTDSKSDKNLQSLNAKLKKYNDEIHELNREITNELQKVIEGLQFSDVTVRPNDDGKKYVEALFAKETINRVIRALPVMDFECRKKVTALFSAYEKLQTAFPDSPVLQSMTQHLQKGDLFKDVFAVFPSSIAALHCGGIIKDCCKVQCLTKTILDHGFVMNPLLICAQDRNFDIASEAFETLRAILTTHKSTAVDFLVANASELCVQFAAVFDQPQNYVAVRQGLKLMSDLLLDKLFVRFTLVFVSDADRLKQVMELMRAGTRGVAFEAFQIFKVFVAHPTPPPKVWKILVCNGKRLIEFINDFQSDRLDENGEFADDKLIVMERLDFLAKEAEFKQQQQQQQQSFEQQHQTTAV